MGFLLKIRQCFIKIWHWLHEKTTIAGIAMIAASGVGLWLNIISSEIGCLIMGSSLTLLLPENSTAQRIGQALLIPVVTVLSKNGSGSMRIKTPPSKPNT